MTASLFSLLVIPALVTGDAPAIQRQAQFEATAFYKSLNLKRVSEALAEPAGGLPRKTIRYEGAAGPAGAAQAVVTLLLERELELPTYYVKGYELTLAKPEAGLAQALQERMRVLTGFIRLNLWPRDLIAKVLAGARLADQDGYDCSLEISLKNFGSARIRGTGAATTIRIEF